MQHDWVQLHPDPIDIGPVLQYVSDAGAGGISIFLGTTRAETHADGRDLIRLDYDAYSEMARQQMRELAAAARERWPVKRLAILHRIGPVGVGEPSVIIAVSTAHRGEAFEACRWIIDTLKKQVTIWKKEVWNTGDATWVEPAAPGEP
jgi:molybdopterin synthase catalytic subunit